MKNITKIQQEKKKKSVQESVEEIFYSPDSSRSACPHKADPTWPRYQRFRASRQAQRATEHTRSPVSTRSTQRRVSRGNESASTCLPRGFTARGIAKIARKVEKAPARRVLSWPRWQLSSGEASRFHKINFSPDSQSNRLYTDICQYISKMMYEIEIFEEVQRVEFLQRPISVQENQTADLNDPCDVYIQTNWRK
jgi:hypothetical protein